MSVPFHSLKPQSPSVSKNGTIFVFTPQTAGHRRMATRSGLPILRNVHRGSLPFPVGYCALQLAHCIWWCQYNIVQRIKLELLSLWLVLLFVVQIILLFFEQIIENKLSSTYIWLSVMNRMVSSRIILVYCLQRTYHALYGCISHSACALF